MIITIDGPVASGKSSVATSLAEKLQIYYLYTGLLYRAVAYILVRRFMDENHKEPTHDEFKRYVNTFDAGSLSFIKDLHYDYGKNQEGSKPYLFYQEEDITDALYQSKFDQLASIVSANKHVRDALLDLQRDVATRYDIVADGRDCGTVVFPDADYKFYLTASVDIRAQRLMLDEKRGESNKTLAEVKAEIEERDKRDSEREVAPLQIPEGAIIIDNSEITLEETVNKFLSKIKK